MSSGKGAGPAGTGADGIVGVGDGAGAADGVADGVGRVTWARGRAEPGPSIAGSAATTRSVISAGRTNRRTDRTAGRR